MSIFSVCTLFTTKISGTTFQSFRKLLTLPYLSLLHADAHIFLLLPTHHEYGVPTC